MLELRLGHLIHLSLQSTTIFVFVFFLILLLLFWEGLEIGTFTESPVTHRASFQLDSVFPHFVCDFLISRTFLPIELGWRRKSGCGNMKIWTWCALLFTYSWHCWKRRIERKWERRGVASSMVKVESCLASVQ